MYLDEEWLSEHDALKYVGRSFRTVQRWRLHGLVPVRRVDGQRFYLLSGLIAARDLLEAAHEDTLIHNSGNGNERGPGRGRGPLRPAADRAAAEGKTAEQIVAEVGCTPGTARAAITEHKQRQLWPLFDQGLMATQIVREGLTDLTQSQAHSAKTKYNAHRKESERNHGNT
ncbi:hypothetical protein D4768_22085 [Rhodococcus erythropolis]|nr:hypothetical protein D4768_22085 [Rhodococcus erythropolis]